MTSVYIPKAKFNANAEQKSRILENLPAAWMKVQGVPART